MKYLLDTHAFLWFVFDDPRMSKRAASIIENPDNEIWMSMVSIWEISIKHSLGKLRFDQPFQSFITEHILETELQLISIKMPHLIMVNQLSWHHRDPFDRFLVAQCKEERLQLVSDDRMFVNYGVDVVW